MQIGTPSPLPAEEVRKWYVRYHTTYGQPGAAEESE